MVVIRARTMNHRFQDIVLNLEPTNKKKDFFFSQQSILKVNKNKSSVSIDVNNN